MKDKNGKPLFATIAEATKARAKARRQQRQLEKEAIRVARQRGEQRRREELEALGKIADKASEGWPFTGRSTDDGEDD